MTALNTTSAEAILKELYDGQSLTEMAHDNHPFFGVVRKYERFRGRNRPIPIRIGRPQGVSASITVAIAGASASTFKSFLLTLRKTYGIADIDGMTIDVTKDKGAFIDALTSEIDGILMEDSNHISSMLYRDYTGAICAVGTMSSKAMTLADPGDSLMFEIGMMVSAAATKTGAIEGTYVSITGVDNVTGIITADANWSTLTGITDSTGYLFRYGDAMNNTGSGLHASGLCVSGLMDWLPSTTPSASESFFGVDRSVHSRLYGNYMDLSGKGLEQGLIFLQSRCAQNGGRPTHCFMNNANYRDLVTALGSKVTYAQETNSVGPGKVANIGFEAIVLHGDAGNIKILPDPDCPVNHCFMLDMSGWELNSAGSAPKILNQDGMRIRAGAADSYIVRTGAYLNLSNNAPGHNGHGLLVSAAT